MLARGIEQRVRKNRQEARGKKIETFSSNTSLLSALCSLLDFL
jgi:hypothetical protein